MAFIKKIPRLAIIKTIPKSFAGLLWDMSKKSRFIHLRVHSEYSLLEGAVKINSLPALCSKMNMPAVALTDTNNLFAALEFSVGASSSGVQPIIGCQIDLQYK